MAIRGLLRLRLGHLAGLDPFDTFGVELEWQLFEEELRQRAETAGVTLDTTDGWRRVYSVLRHERKQLEQERDRLAEEVERLRPLAEKAEAQEKPERVGRKKKWDPFNHWKLLEHVRLAHRIGVAKSDVAACEWLADPAQRPVAAIVVDGPVTVEGLRRQLNAAKKLAKKISLVAAL